MPITQLFFVPLQPDSAVKNIFSEVQQMTFFYVREKLEKEISRS